MRVGMVVVSFMAVIGLLALAGPSAAACDPDGEVKFVCGMVSPEDLAAVPQSPWVIVSSMEHEGQLGHLYAADTRDHSTTVLFPTATSQPRHDTETYGSCPEPATRNQFEPHGISLRPGNNSIHTLYVVRHGSRESIEVFQVDAGGVSPTLTWIGCAVAPETLGLNAVVALPDGGFAATSPRTGNVWEWHTATGWKMVPGSEDTGPNGLEVSPDGQWFYVAGWGSQSVIRLSRGRTPVQKDTVEVGFHIDNVHWAPDGSLLAAGHSASAPAVIIGCVREGHCDEVSSRVSKVDPQRLTAQEIVRYPPNNFLILGTVAIQVGEEIWFGGGAGGDRIARFPAPPQ